MRAIIKTKKQVPENYLSQRKRILIGRKKPQKISRVTTLIRGIKALDKAFDNMMRQEMEGKDRKTIRKQIQKKYRKLRNGFFQQLSEIVERDKKFKTVYSDKVFSEIVQSKLTSIGNHSIAMIDIDFFKTEVNDKYGHAAGDIILGLFANTASQIAKKYGGIVSRYGGEEFAFYLNANALKLQKILATDFNQALIRNYKQLIFSYKKQGIPLSSLPPLPTFSAGIAEQRRKTKGKRDLRRKPKGIVEEKKSLYAYLMKTADERLYFSKKAGRNRITISETKKPVIIRKASNK